MLEKEFWITADGNGCDATSKKIVELKLDGKVRNKID
jgi:hypothetical protein